MDTVDLLAIGFVGYLLLNGITQSNASLSSQNSSSTSLIGQILKSLQSSGSSSKGGGSSGGGSGQGGNNPAPQGQPGYGSGNDSIDTSSDNPQDVADAATAAVQADGGLDTQSDTDTSYIGNVDGPSLDPSVYEDAGDFFDDGDDGGDDGGDDD